MGLDKLFDEADRTQDNPEEKDHISINSLVYGTTHWFTPIVFHALSLPVKTVISTVRAPGLDA